MAAPRGRLSVLANVMQKPYRAILPTSFRGGSIQARGRWMARGREIPPRRGRRTASSTTTPCTLSADGHPSHLEAVNPVVLGKVRAKQDQMGRMPSARKVVGVLLHGDAAFAGQGVVAEGLGLSGTARASHGRHDPLHREQPDRVHHQKGSAPHLLPRSSPYPTDIALMVEAPIFHVNGDDPRGRGPRRQGGDRVPPDVRQGPCVIDMFCYRRFGSQRGRRAHVHQPGHVQEDQDAEDHASALYPSGWSRTGLIP